MICENCGNEHDGSYGSGRFCSDHCRKSFCGKHAHGIKRRPRLENRSPYGTWKCKYCGIVLNTKQELSQHIRNVHPTPKGQPWNKGLTKETDARVQKCASTFKSNYLSGKFHLGGWKMSIEGRELISKRIRERISEKGGFHHIKWYKVSNLDGIEYTVRGTWELNVAKRLNQMGIRWVKNVYIQYTSDIKRNYFPDFYLPENDSYIEVKGYYSPENIIKMKHVMECNPDIKIYFISSNVYQDFIDGNISLDDRLLMTKVSC